MSFFSFENFFNPSNEFNAFNFNEGSRCQFSEWSIKSKLFNYFQTQNGINICLFCANFCEDFYSCKEITVKESKEIPECDCHDAIHFDIKQLYQKLKLLSDIENFEFYNKDLSEFEFLTKFYLWETEFWGKDDKNVEIEKIFF